MLNTSRHEGSCDDNKAKGAPGKVKFTIRDSSQMIVKLNFLEIMTTWGRSGRPKSI